jgi:hypothetical protein
MLMKRLLGVLLVCLFCLASCAAPSQQGTTTGGKPPAGFGLVAKGLVNLILSPVQIAAGILQGIASVPFYLNTYESAYGKRISAVPATGDTGEVFRRMMHASEYFQKVLARYGVKDARHYFLTSIDTANNQGYTLFAVIYRPLDSITVIDKYDGKTVRTFTREDRLYYEPFARDAQGRSLDTVIDWAGLARDFYATQKAQAVLITMAANSVVNEKRSPDYWETESRWIGGDFEAIVEQRMNSVKNKMSL